MTSFVRSAKNIGTAIRSERKKRGLSQADLASKSGIWQETISKIENGQSGTKIETLFELLAALDLELSIQDRSKGSTDELEALF